MALIACHECGKEISDKAPACPHCGAPALDATPPASPPAAAKSFPWAFAISLGVVATVALSCVGSSKPTAGKASPDRAMAEAFVMCHDRLKNSPPPYSTVEVPVVMNQGTTEAPYFIWGVLTKQARILNENGSVTEVTASCSVDAKQQRITSLVLDGKPII